MLNAFLAIMFAILAAYRIRECRRAAHVASVESRYGSNRSAFLEILTGGILAALAALFAGRAAGFL